MADDGALLVTRAAAFAAWRHADQKWKHAAGKPATGHLAEVALLVAQAPRSAPVIAAAWLHDSVEDEVASLMEIERDFGAGVAAMVADCTDDMRLSKAERWRRQIEETPHKSEDTRAIKIADKISNLRAIAFLGADAIDDAMTYLPFAERVAAGCHGLSPHLDAAFDAAAASVRAILAAPNDH